MSTRNPLAAKKISARFEKYYFIHLTFFKIQQYETALFEIKSGDACNYT